MVLFPLLLGVLLTIGPVASQVAPLSWNSTISISVEERVRLAGAALDVAIEKLSADGLFDDEGYGITGNLYSQMVEFDIATNQTKYQNVLEQYFQLQETKRANFSDPYVSHPFIQSQHLALIQVTIDQLRRRIMGCEITAPYASPIYSLQTLFSRTYGHAAIKAYAAYKNSVFLQYAVESWWFGRSRTLSQSDVSAGKIAGKNFTITKNCQSATMVGGAFWVNDPAEPSVAGVATGYFVALSALLAEATSDPLYLQAANESASFIHSHLFNIQSIVQDYISADPTNDGCGVQASTDPSSSGLMIEGLSILFSITNDASIQKLLSDLLVAVIPNTAWQGNNGIVAVQGIDGGLTLLRGLNTVYTRNSTDATLRQYVGEYIAVQFNAVTNLATAGGTNIYGSSWTGPPSAIFSGTNQTVALAALIGGIGLETTVSSASPATSPFPSSSPPPSPSPSSPSPTPPPSHFKSNNLAAILGGTFGGLAILVLGMMTLWFLRRQRPRSNEDPFSPSVIPEPFVASVISPFTSEATSHSSLPPGARHGEKHGDHHGNLLWRPSQPTQRFASEGGGSSAVNSQVTGHGNVDGVPASVLPTEQLVQILNERLQNRRWTEGETPPDYFSARSI
ncbi:Glycoside hydrolase family 76 protein [Mycena venus]|uniref:Glycoside hydrolase family 76 protein n=1 Tax=Mycena venus TaxID=2733690 RepID=A0A8H7DEK1_9AGAR|nr:Glycoside hydrolase family 76 protein [Mycena venus]